MVQKATESGSLVVERSISMKLRNESRRKDWRIINRACGKSRAGTISAVEVNHGDVYIRTEGRVETEREIKINLRQKLGDLNENTPLMVGSLAKALVPVCENKKNSVYYTVRRNTLRGQR